MPGLKLSLGKKKQKDESSDKKGQGAQPKEQAQAGAAEQPANQPPTATAPPPPTQSPPVADVKPPAQPADSALGNMNDIFTQQTDERDQFHKTIGKELETVSARSLLLESRDIARSMHRMGRIRR